MKPTGTELRYSIGSELRAVLENFEISGIAAAYMVNSRNLGGFVERIAPTAFVRSLRDKADVKMLLNHQPDNILGRTKSNTLVLSDSPQGLRFRCKLDESNSFHQSVYASIKRGDLDECSFAFQVPDGGDDWQDNGAVDENGQRCALRTLKDVTLLDASVVTYPAYPQGTHVDARSLGVYVVNQKPVQNREAESKLHLLDAAFHRMQAEALARNAAFHAEQVRRLRILRASFDVAASNRALAEQVETEQRDAELRERMRAQAGIYSR